LKVDSIVNSRLTKFGFIRIIIEVNQKLVCVLVLGSVVPLVVVVVDDETCCALDKIEQIRFCFYYYFLVDINL
jgi:hypothetical protein